MRLQTGAGYFVISYAIHLPAMFILAAIALDLLVGDPLWLPHPVQLMGVLIKVGDRSLHTGDRRSDLLLGGALAVFVIAASGIVTAAIIHEAERFYETAGAGLAVVIASSTLAIRGLDRAARDIKRSLDAGDDHGARGALPSLVGRNPQALSHNGIIRATVESVAESTCDGIVAPLFFLFLAGPTAAVAYKAINTLDSMIGHRTRRYFYFGRLAARIDDAANFIPARLTAFGIIAGAGLLKRRSGQAFAACMSDARQHPSPNAGYPEASMAGALGFHLGGDTVYGGEVEHRPRMGRPERSPHPDDIATACQLMYFSTALMFVLFALSRFALRKFMVL